MRLAILSGNPKTTGLTQSIIDAVKLGAIEGGAEVDEIRLCDLGLQRCQICGDGWGICRSEHRCAYGDDGFEAARVRVRAADAVVIATPVYWWETSEALKAFLDRLRRCEFRSYETLRGKQVLLVAVPGGSGQGMLTCLEQMERFCRHADAVIFDYIGVNRWNSDYKRVAARAAGLALASGRKNGDTV